jgi:Uma2 family endonuclease
MVQFEGSTALRADHVPGPGQGNWTYKDYAALDDGKRYEILDGVLYMSPVPSWPHFDVVKQITRYLLRFVEDAGLGTIAFAPVDVELSPKNLVQPDVFIVLRENQQKIHHSRLIGAPDLAVEVLSPGNTLHDRQEKFEKYQRFGVKEYWIANPMQCVVEVFVLEQGAYRLLGRFRGRDAILSRIVPQMAQVHAEELFRLPELEN